MGIYVIFTHRIQIQSGHIPGHGCSLFGSVFIHHRNSSGKQNSSCLAFRHRRSHNQSHGFNFLHFFYMNMGLNTNRPGQMRCLSIHHGGNFVGIGSVGLYRFIRIYIVAGLHGSIHKHVVYADDAVISSAHAVNVIQNVYTFREEGYGSFINDLIGTDSGQGYCNKLLRKAQLRIQMQPSCSISFLPDAGSFCAGSLGLGSDIHSVNGNIPELVAAGCHS